MFSGFQPSGHQHSGYQIVENIEIIGSGWEHIPSYQKPEYQRKTLEEKRLELQRIDEEIAQAEQAKLDKLATEDIAAENVMRELTMIALQDEINRLRTERVWLMRLVDDEEAIMALLLTMPLH